MMVRFHCHFKWLCPIWLYETQQWLLFVYVVVVWDHLTQTNHNSFHLTRFERVSVPALQIICISRSELGYA